MTSPMRILRVARVYPDVTGGALPRWRCARDQNGDGPRLDGADGRARSVAAERGGATAIGWSGST